MTVVRSLFFLLSVSVCASAMGTSWDTCRKLGLTSVVDCKRYDEDPAFRAQVRQSIGLNSETSGRALPAPAPQPSVITSCDNGGCWDNLGNRYNRGAGNTFFGPSGACQKVGSTMQCP